MTRGRIDILECAYYLFYIRGHIFIHMHPNLRMLNIHIKTSRLTRFNPRKIFCLICILVLFFTIIRLFSGTMRQQHWPEKGLANIKTKRERLCFREIFWFFDSCFWIIHKAEPEKFDRIFSFTGPTTELCPKLCSGLSHLITVTTLVYETLRCWC